MRNIVAGTLLAGSLFLLGCPPKVDMNQMSKAVTGQENLYGEAQRVTNNARSIAAEGYIPSTQLESRSDKSLVKRDLEDYFFQGRELEGLEFKSIENTSYSSNPHILSSREIIDFQQEYSNIFLDNPREIGISTYSFLDKKSEVEQYILRFETELENWKFLNWMKEYQEIDMDIVFVNKNLSLIFEIDINTIEAERSFYDSLINYSKRIGGAFYGSSFEVSENIYRKLNIPLEKSAEYLSEALRFQRRSYDMNDEELSNFLDKEFDIKSFRDQLFRYHDGKINRDEFEKIILTYGKKVETKLFFRLPKFEDRLGNMKEGVSEMFLLLIQSYEYDNLRKLYLDKLGEQ